jgi:hypothetical protein
MTVASVARSADGTEGYNTLKPQAAVLELEIYDDARLPDAAEFIVEGLASPLRVAAADCYDAERGVYLLLIEDLVPGARCTIQVNLGEQAAELLDDADLYDYVQRASRSSSEPPLILQFAETVFDHARTADELSIDEPVPEDEDDDWDIVGEFDALDLADEGLGQHGAPPDESSDATATDDVPDRFEFREDGEN